ncbi:MAG: Aliphatic amidase AmiE [Gemmatimonadetes bacterium]|nr:Aliphatic amidase AmiE [Gemmatimonadota bacterium]
MTESIDSGQRDVTLRVALGEYDTGWQQPEVSVSRAEVCVSRAASTGARLVVLPEMCTTGFTMDPDNHAESMDGPAFGRFSAMAHKHDVWILAGLAVRDGGNQNVAAVFDPNGNLVASYAKQRLFAYGEEHDHYTPGNSSVTIDIEGVRVSPFVCYDLRFPELFRAVALQTDLMIVIANWPSVRRAHWDALLLARAIENLFYVVGVNRTGTGGGLVYDGGSVAYDPWGVSSAIRVAVASPSVVDVSTARVAGVRAQYPFLADLSLVLSS